MAKITYISISGEARTVDVPNGGSVMRGAVDNNIHGIIGDCGGACSCATCHVYVDPQWFDKVGEVGPIEEILLEEVCDPQANSRLGCQIEITDDLDGLVVRLPDKQV